MGTPRPGPLRPHSHSCPSLGVDQPCRGTRSSLFVLTAGKWPELPGTPGPQLSAMSPAYKPPEPPKSLTQTYAGWELSAAAAAPCPPPKPGTGLRWRSPRARCPCGGAWRAHECPSATKTHRNRGRWGCGSLLEASNHPGHVPLLAVMVGSTQLHTPTWAKSPHQLCPSGCCGPTDREGLGRRPCHSPLLELKEDLGQSAAPCHHGHVDGPQEAVMHLYQVLGRNGRQRVNRLTGLDGHTCSCERPGHGACVPA